MPRLFESTKIYIRSLNEIDFLLRKALDESNAGNENNRRIYIKLIIVTLVSKIQVFTEKAMEEYLYKLKLSGKRLSSLSPHIRCVSARKSLIRKKLEKKLDDRINISTILIEDLKNDIKEIGDHFDNRKKILRHFDISVKFPLGKTGSGELIDLLQQIEGKNIFTNKIDISKLDSLLNIRHNVIHQDSNPNITEVQVKQYIFYSKKLIYFINNYLYTNCH